MLNVLLKVMFETRFVKGFQSGIGKNLLALVWFRFLFNRTAWLRVPLYSKSTDVLKKIGTKQTVATHTEPINAIRLLSINTQSALMRHQQHHILSLYLAFSLHAFGYIIHVKRCPNDVSVSVFFFFIYSLLLALASTCHKR